jgi:hypothetical protein
MINTAIRTYANEYGGRAILLFLLFLLALYEFYSIGLGGFAAVCFIPAFILFIILTFKYRMFLFWILFSYNYFVQFGEIPHPPLPMSLPNEMLQLSLLMIALIDIKDNYWGRTKNIMILAISIWCGFCTLELLNDTCDIGINIGAWYTGARMLGFQLFYISLVYCLYITSHKTLIQYLFLWATLALFAVFWVYKQKYIGLTPSENAWLYYGAGNRTHLLQAGTLIRYWSIFSDAANFGIGMASTGVAFVIFGITAKIRWLKFIFTIVGAACIWAMFPSGTRTAIACLMAGFMAYIFLSKSFKIAIPFTIIFAVFAFILVFTKIGDGNQQIRRMRSAFDKKDASANVRSMNQAVMKKYLKDAPWGIGVGMGREQVPANNKYSLMSTIAPDSEYVFIWIHTGIIGITIFLITTAMILIGACWIVFFKLKSPSLRGIGAGFCCAFVSQQLGAYGNQVLMQFPNGLVFYGGISIVFILPYIEDSWIEWETKKLAKQNEKKRLRLEKKKQSRVKTVF